MEGEERLHEVVKLVLVTSVLVLNEASEKVSVCCGLGLHVLLRLALGGWRALLDDRRLLGLLNLGLARVADTDDGVAVFCRQRLFNLFQQLLVSVLLRTCHSNGETILKSRFVSSSL